MHTPTRTLYMCHPGRHSTPVVLVGSQPCLIVAGICFRMPRCIHAYTCVYYLVVIPLMRCLCRMVGMPVMFCVWYVLHQWTSKLVPHALCIALFCIHINSQAPLCLYILVVIAKQCDCGKVPDKLKLGFRFYWLSWPRAFCYIHQKMPSCVVLGAHFIMHLL